MTPIESVKKAMLQIAETPMRLNDDEVAAIIISTIAANVTDAMLVAFGMSYSPERLTETFVREKLLEVPDEMDALRAAIAAAIREGVRG